MPVRDFPQRSGNSGDFILDKWLDLVANRLNIDDQIELTSVADGDEVEIFDVSANATRKITKANLTTGFSTGITLSTEQASTSGTSIDFTGIPTGIKRITIMFFGCSTNGTSVPLIQIGDAGGIEATGYLGASSNLSAGVNFTTGWGLVTTHAATVVWHGAMTLSLEDSSDDSWVASGTIGISSAALVYSNGGSKSLSSTLDRVRITTVGGTDAFDAGVINISYEK